MTGTQSDAIRLVIIDDHAMFREGLACSLEREPDLTVAGHFGSASEALPALDACEPDVILLDVDPESENAPDFIGRARRLGFEGQVLVVTAGISDRQAVQLIQAGVAGILHKHHSTEVLCVTIRKVAKGQSSLEDRYLTPLFRSVDRMRTAGRPPLADRDRTVFRLIVQGLSNREIGARLDVSEGAVKAYLRQLFARFEVRTRAQLVKVALERYRDEL